MFRIECLRSSEAKNGSWCNGTRVKDVPAYDSAHDNINKINNKYFFLNRERTAVSGTFSKKLILIVFIISNLIVSGTIFPEDANKVVLAKRLEDNL